jgi:hypothetical protein
VRRVLTLGISLAALGGCGGTVDGGPTGEIGVRPAGGAGGRASFLPDAAAGGEGPTVLPDAGDNTTPYQDPGCPPETKIQGVNECQVGTPSVGCAPGDRCVPYVVYGERCRTEEVGTRCAVAGPAVQGDDCTSESCADGFVCVSAGSGFECAQICTNSGGKSNCPPGLLCMPLDVPDRFVCG